MKVNVKQRYKELLEHIQFPAFIYYYETNRILGMNHLAIEILGENARNIKELTLNNVRPKYSKTLLENGSKILYKQEICTVSGNLLLDIEINVIVVDDRHMCIVFFEHSYKQCFGQNLWFEVPRLYWKNKEQIYLGMNDSFKKDYKIQLTNEEIQKKELKYKDILPLQDNSLLDVEEMKIIRGKESIYESLQMIKVDQDSNLFTTVSRFPIFNKNGTVIGLLGIYHIIVDKLVYKNCYCNAIKDTYIMYEEQKKERSLISVLLRLTQIDKNFNVILDAIFGSLEREYNIEFISITGYHSSEKKIESIYQWNNLIGLHIDDKVMDVYYKNYASILKEVHKKGFLVIDRNIEQDKYNQLLLDMNMKSILLLELDIKDYDRGMILFGTSMKSDWSIEFISLLNDVIQIVEIILEKHTLKQTIKKLQDSDNERRG